MRNFKTDKGYKVVLDYIDWNYDWKELREYFGLDEREVYIRFEWNRELRDIDDIWISEEWLTYLFYRNSTEDHKEHFSEEFENDPEYYETYYWHFEREYELRPFYISYYGSWCYRLQFCEAHEASWMMFIKRREDKEEKEKAEEILKKVFEHYLDWEFYYVQIYKPTIAEFKEKSYSEYEVRFYDFNEDGWIFYLDQDDAISWIPEEYGKILRDTEEQNFQSFELIHKPKLENKTDN